jgi:hypothetical protein
VATLTSLFLLSLGKTRPSSNYPKIFRTPRTSGMSSIDTRKNTSTKSSGDFSSFTSCKKEFFSPFFSPIFFPRFFSPNFFHRFFFSLKFFSSSLQSFAIPGSIFLSILSGFLFSFPVALFTVCTVSSDGSFQILQNFSPIFPENFGGDRLTERRND